MACLPELVAALRHHLQQFTTKHCAGVRHTGGCKRCWAQKTAGGSARTLRKLRVLYREIKAGASERVVYPAPSFDVVRVEHRTKLDMGRRTDPPCSYESVLHFLASLFSVGQAPVHRKDPLASKASPMDLRSGQGVRGSAGLVSSPRDPPQGRAQEAVVARVQFRTAMYIPLPLSELYAPITQPHEAQLPGGGFHTAPGAYKDMLHRTGCGSAARRRCNFSLGVWCPTPSNSSPGGALLCANAAGRIACPASRARVWAVTYWPKRREARPNSSYPQYRVSATPACLRPGGVLQSRFSVCVSSPRPQACTNACFMESPP